MNRRSFFSTIAKAAAGFAILPSAVTYARHWKTINSGIVVPEYNGIEIRFNNGDLGVTTRQLFNEQETISILRLMWYWRIMHFSREAFEQQGKRYTPKYRFNPNTI